MLVLNREGIVNERGMVMASMAIGAALGGVVGYLFFTEDGRRRREQIEPALDQLMREAQRLRGTVEKVQDAAGEGMRMFYELRDRTRGGLGMPSGMTH